MEGAVESHTGYGSALCNTLLVLDRTVQVVLSCERRVILCSFASFEMNHIIRFKKSELR